jgi:hypothetical protein
MQETRLIVHGASGILEHLFTRQSEVGVCDVCGKQLVAGRIYTLCGPPANNLSKHDHKAHTGCHECVESRDYVGEKAACVACLRGETGVRACKAAGLARVPAVLNEKCSALMDVAADAMRSDDARRAREEDERAVGELAAKEQRRKDALAARDAAHATQQSASEGEGGGGDECEPRKKRKYKTRTEEQKRLTQLSRNATMERKRLKLLRMERDAFLLQRALASGARALDAVRPGADLNLHHEAIQAHLAVMAEVRAQVARGVEERDAAQDDVTVVGSASHTELLAARNAAGFASAIEL